MVRSGGCVAAAASLIANFHNSLNKRAAQRTHTYTRTVGANVRLCVEQVVHLTNSPISGVITGI